VETAVVATAATEAEGVAAVAVAAVAEVVVVLQPGRKLVLQDKYSLGQLTVH